MDPKIGKQGGWVGLIVLLLAVLIVAFLAKDALLKHGMLGGAETSASRAGTPGERTRSPAAGVVEQTDVSGATPAPASALDRARGLQDTLQKESEKRAGEY
jgi:hypothetical protein